MRTLVLYIKESRESKINASNVKDYYDKDGMDTNVKEWYHKEYKTDELWEYLKDDITFKDVLKDLVNPKGDVYAAIFKDADTMSDSLVREHIFGRLSDICGEDYDEIYYLWLNQE